MFYSAKTSYSNGQSQTSYVEHRFSGIMGKLRWNIEQQAVASNINLMSSGSVVLDCPCGTGRWWKALSRRSSKLIAADISPGMRKYASESSHLFSGQIEILEADATALCLEDNCVDYAFCHALTKHLPIPVQYQVLSELSRVSKYGVICSFGIFSHLTYEFWRHRRLSESYPLLYEQLLDMASSSGLRISRMKRCTTFLGVEHSVFFKCL